MKKIIYDLGAHRGEDTEYYLKLKYKVVSVEADPTLFSYLKKKFFLEKDLILLNNIISNENNKSLFYRHKKKPDWNTATKKIAKMIGFKYFKKPILINSISLKTLAQKYGQPYYIKVDIEGNELKVVNQIKSLKEKPKYFCFEDHRYHSHKVIEKLRFLGFGNFKLYEQSKIINSFDRKNNWKFGIYSSGKLFGSGKWLSYSVFIKKYYSEVRSKSGIKKKKNGTWYNIIAKYDN